MMKVLNNGELAKRQPYTVMRARLVYFKNEIAQHRKNKRGWNGTKETYQEKLTHMLNRVNYYQTRLREPEYLEEGARVRNRKRRKKRKPLRRIVKTVPTQKPTLSTPNRWLLDGFPEESEYLAHLPWMIARLKKKKFKTMRQLAYHYRKPIKWVREALDLAVGMNLVSSFDLCNTFFRRPGRPKKGKPRGPYKKKIKSQ